MSFDSLGLSPDILRAVAEQGYREPTPIQQQAIPAVLEGRDLMASARPVPVKQRALRCRCCNT
ncbi:ATP-dependent RNA helicase RhlE [Escherichia coli O104:H4 str. LB226692]|nr:ATP-dependent RNA helicase RhlE [Escherichia coli O104:H4 str. LB226692]